MIGLILIQLLVLGVRASAGTSPEDYDFSAYVAKFNFKWAPGSSEWRRRRELFEGELRRVTAHNAAKRPWKEGINKFSAFTSDEKKVISLSHF
ncbi:unnamed protein product [Sphagnum balticum]